MVLTYNDLAVQCFSRGLYQEATLLLNKAIEEEKNQAGLYLNRGGEPTPALKLRPLHPAPEQLLLDLHHSCGSRDLWLVKI